MAGVSIQNLTRSAFGGPRSAFSAIAKNVLPSWDISLVFLGAAKARALNKQLRGKEYVPNVLSYALGEKSGEVIICLPEAKRQASLYGMRTRAFILYLFIHGVLHIKGWVHSARMEKCEQDLLARFLPAQAGAKGGARVNSYETAHCHRHRRRHVPGKNGRRRGTLR